ncbi:tyrosine-type recombinase/integrase [Comamonas testosteroni]|uniref:tyrosine-type recombinase/integrase n=1 Tax=Comamonas testosteroni TaxID=285 RepID=UPI00211555CC|nr:tyrosine-type recombinase/integrase [Comamonas testosteroni]
MPNAASNLIAFRFFSGLRTSEMVALRWHSIDWNKKQVLIHEAVVKGLRKQTKTNKARLVSLNSRALDALERQKEQTPRAQLGSLAGDVMSQAAPKDSQTIFADPTHGEPWADDKRFRNPFGCRCSRRWAFGTARPTTCATPMRRCCLWQVPRRPMQPSRWGIRWRCF